MTDKCLGCGVRLQTNNPLEMGYIRRPHHKTCERCFRIKHYNESKIITKKNDEFLKMLQDINKTNDLVLLLVDVFYLEIDLDFIRKYLENDLILVITKYDLLKPYLSEEKLISYLKKAGFKQESIVIISSLKNYNLDRLFTLIKTSKKSNNVYILGNTNVGKSTLVNKIIYNYSNLKKEITTSQLPTTTLDEIKIVINDDLTIIDTPGLIEENTILDYVDAKMISKIIPSSVIKPQTFQLRTPQTIMIEDLVMLSFFSKNKVILYLSSRLTVKRNYKEIVFSNLTSRLIEIPAYHDLVIKGLGFIKIIEATTVNIQYVGQTDIYIRKSLI